MELSRLPMFCVMPIEDNSTILRSFILYMVRVWIGFEDIRNEHSKRRKTNVSCSDGCSYMG